MRASPAGTALFSVAQIRAIEQAALANLPPYTLMQRAGAAAAAAARQLNDNSDTAHILILAGPGNNGGDALEAACDLSSGGLEVSVLLMAGNSNKQPADAAHALERARACAIDWITPAQLATDTSWTLVLDGLFGIGMQRALGPEYRAIAARINALHCPVLALDIASGLNADTGCIATDANTDVDADTDDRAIPAPH